MSELPKDLARIVESGSMPSNLEVITDGEPQDPNTINPALYGWIMQAAQLGQLVRIRKALEDKFAKETSLGGEDGTRRLPATSVVQELNLISNWPYRPWISLFVTNDGPNTLFIAINYAHQWKEIRVTESRTISHVNADERIHKVFYRCDDGETASARIDGQY